MTSSRPRALLLVHRLPFPPDKGDKIRSWHLLKFLAARYDVALGTYIDDPADRPYAPQVEELCAEMCVREISSFGGKLRALTGLVTGEPLSFATYRDRQMSDFVARQREKGVDVEIYFSGAMTRFAEGAKAPVIVDLVDADSAKWQSYAEDGGFPGRFIYGREARLVGAAEQAAVKNSRRTFFVTPEEAAVARGGEAGEGIDYYRNGIDLDFWDPAAEITALETPFDIVFTGAMDYRPNAEGAVWFVRNVWPSLKAQYPDLTFGIVGRNPAAAVKALETAPGVTVTGRVEDVRPYLKGAKLAVAPLAIARGVQNKVLEAMAMGVPVVATSGAIAGTGAEPGTHIIEADPPEDMSARIAGLLAAPHEAARIGAAGRALIEAEYSWDLTLRRLEDALPDL